MMQTVSRREYRRFLRFMKFSVSDLLVLALLTVSVPIPVGAQDVQLGAINGIAVTGLNRLFDQPLTDLGPFGNFGFTTVAAYNVTGADPIPLTPESSSSTVLATFVDPELVAALGLPIDVVDPTLQNVPLREVGVNIAPTGTVFQPLPDALDNPPFIPFQPSQAVPSQAITLGDWFKAKGAVTLRCLEGESPVVRVVISDMIPRRVYTVWAFFLDKQAEPPLVNFGPIRPLGGVPNVIITDSTGRGSLEAVMNFCPLDVKEGEVPLGAIFVAFHSDQQVYGTMPSFTDKGRFPGAMAHVQLYFPIAATGIQ